MAFDGFTAAGVVSELREKILGGRVDKIYQPENDEIVLSVRSAGENHRLLLSANAAAPRVCLTEQPRENPFSPPLFCMVMRKHLSGRVTDIYQGSGFERVITITVESPDEMGFMSEKRLIAEIMGKHSNIILVNEDGVIIDSVKRVSHEKSSVREVLPGKAYAPPPSQGKLNPLEFDGAVFAAGIEASPGIKIQDFIYQRYSGISPVMAGEICFRSGADPSAYCAELAGGAAVQALALAMEAVFARAAANEYRPTLYLDESGAVFEFSAFEMEQYSALPSRSFDSVSVLAEYYYAEKGGSQNANQKLRELKKLIAAHTDRCRRKLEINYKTLSEAVDAEKYRVYGELLRANIYMAEKGTKRLRVLNYFAEEPVEAEIPLDPNKTPSENMQSFFRIYNKKKRAASSTETQIRQNEEELVYLESVALSAGNCSGEADINEIRRELAEQGFIKKKSAKTGKASIKKSKPFEYLSGDGFAVFAGKNNIQNDELTFKTASAGDIWLHAKDTPGSHVIIKTEGREVSEATLNAACKIAAFHSSAGSSGASVSVDYCRRGNVKKRPGAKPGMVIYDNYKTAHVSCGKEEIKGWLPTPGRP